MLDRPLPRPPLRAASVPPTNLYVRSGGMVSVGVQTAPDDTPPHASPRSALTEPIHLPRQHDPALEAAEAVAWWTPERPALHFTERPVSYPASAPDDFSLRGDNGHAESPAVGPIVAEAGIIAEEGSVGEEGSDAAESSEAEEVSVKRKAKGKEKALFPREEELEEGRPGWYTALDRPVPVSQDTEPRPGWYTALDHPVQFTLIDDPEDFPAQTRTRKSKSLDEEEEWSTPASADWDSASAWLSTHPSPTPSYPHLGREGFRSSLYYAYLDHHRASCPGNLASLDKEYVETWKARQLATTLRPDPSPEPYFFGGAYDLTGPDFAPEPSPQPVIQLDRSAVGPQDEVVEHESTAAGPSEFATRASDFPFLAQEPEPATGPDFRLDIPASEPKLSTDVAAGPSEFATRAADFDFLSQDPETAAGPDYRFDIPANPPQNASKSDAAGPTEFATRAADFGFLARGSEFAGKSDFPTVADFISVTDFPAVPRTPVATQQVGAGASLAPISEGGERASATELDVPTGVEYPRASIPTRGSTLTNQTTYTEFVDFASELGVVPRPMPAQPTETLFVGDALTIEPFFTAPDLRFTSAPDPLSEPRFTSAPDPLSVEPSTSAPDPLTVDPYTPQPIEALPTPYQTSPVERPFLTDPFAGPSFFSEPLRRDPDMWAETASQRTSRYIETGLPSRFEAVQSQEEETHLQRAHTIAETGRRHKPRLYKVVWHALTGGARNVGRGTRTAVFHTRQASST